MISPSPRHWIDHRWGSIEKVFPGFTMDWLYGTDGADRLKHHRWMLSRPSFQTVVQELHRAIAQDGNKIIDSVISNPEFPPGEQRDLALRFFRHLQRPDGGETAMFLMATACELLGTTAYCAFQEAALKEWIEKAIAIPVPPYPNLYNLLTNCLAQTGLRVLGCFPYTGLWQQIRSPNDLSFKMNPSDGNRQMLLTYCTALSGELQRISKHPPSGCTYHESEVH